MAKISKHFTRKEMACKCGCGLDSMDAETLKIADEARDFVGHRITPNSAARCAIHNKNIGSNYRSQHRKCRAIDLPTRKAKELYAYLCDKYPNQYGFGLYSTFVHIDTRTDGGARWHG